MCKKYQNLNNYVPKSVKHDYVDLGKNNVERVVDFSNILGTHFNILMRKRKGGKLWLIVSFFKRRSLKRKGENVIN